MENDSFSGLGLLDVRGIVVSVVWWLVFLWGFVLVFVFAIGGMLSVVHDSVECDVDVCGLCCCRMSC